MTNQINENSTTNKADFTYENENKLGNRKKEGRNHVVDAQKQMSSQATAGVFDEEQS